MNSCIGRKEEQRIYSNQRNWDFFFFFEVQKVKCENKSWASMGKYSGKLLRGKQM